jgi:hypothetical protein
MALSASESGREKYRVLSLQGLAIGKVFLGHLGQIVTLILSLNPTRRVLGVRLILGCSPIYIYHYIKVHKTMTI